MKKMVVLILAAVLMFTVCSVSVVAADYGDINCDGRINSLDAVLLAQYLAKWNVDISDEGMIAADVLKDGRVNSLDAVLLAQYLARWNVQLGGGSSKPDDTTQGGGYGDIEVPADDLVFG